MEGFRNEHSIGESSVTPNFDKLSQTIEINIQKIVQNVSSMQKMVTQVNFSSESEIRNQFQQIQNYTEQLARETSTAMKVIMAMPLQSADQRQNRQNKLTRERLKEEFLSALNMFQKMQRVAADKNNEEMRRVKAQNINIGDPFAMGKPSHELIELEVATIRKQEQMQLQSEKEIREFEEREQRVLELEKNITSVNDIFKELGTIIHEQAGMVDSIEASIEQSVGHVESGTQQLHHASNSQTKLRKKKLYILIVVVIILTIIAIIIFHH